MKLGHVKFEAFFWGAGGVGWGDENEKGEGNEEEYSIAVVSLVVAVWEDLLAFLIVVLCLLGFIFCSCFALCVVRH